MIVLVAQEETVGSVNCLRHNPACTTSGMFAPTGMLCRVKEPSTLVVVLTSGEPVICCPEEGPSVKGSTGALGT